MAKDFLQALLLWLDKSYLKNELDQRMHWVQACDLETQMDHLSQFKSSCFLQVAMLEDKSKVNIPQILNNITEVILTKIYEINFDFLINHYGVIEKLNRLPQKIPFGIIAYGKLGAKELSYASDLDLVFLYNTQQDAQIQCKDNTISVETFSLRLAQRIIQMLSTQTSSGKLYEVDVRLRPAGRAGLLVSCFSAYAKYMLEKAWTWEHQALVKARVVVGPPSLMTAFDNLRKAILTQKRDPLTLAEEIKKMRLKMLAHHLSKKEDLKSTKGGLADIDFIVQYYTLLYARSYPKLVNLRNDLKILQQLCHYQLITQEVATALMSAHDYYQMLSRRIVSQPEYDLAKDRYLGVYLQNISLIWDNIFNRGLR